MFLGPAQAPAPPPDVFPSEFHHTFGLELYSPVAHGKQIQEFVMCTFFSHPFLSSADVQASSSASTVQHLPACAFKVCVARVGPPCVCVHTFLRTFHRKCMHGKITKMIQQKGFVLYFASCSSLYMYYYTSSELTPNYLGMW